MRCSIQRSFALIVMSLLVWVSGCQGADKAADDVPEQNLSMNGYIKGNPADGKFTVTGSRGTFTVDMSKSSIERDSQAIPATSLKDGAFVTVLGKLKGDTLTARKIRLVGDKGEDVQAPVAVDAPGGSGG